MGNSFRNITVALAGDFGAMGDKVKQWVEINGGTFSTVVKEDVTHVIVTQKAYRKAIPAVTEAKRIKGLKIVSIEWLEDSLLSKGRRPTREGPYMFTRRRQSAKKKVLKANNAAVRPPTADGGGMTPKPKTEGDDYHIYKDQSGVSHCAVLLRPREGPKGKEKHIVKLLESDSVPHAYATFVKYSRVGRSASEYLTPTGSTWETAFSTFTRFFQAKSGQSWDSRDTKPDPKKGKTGLELPLHDGWFEYNPGAGA